MKSKSYSLDTSRNQNPRFRLDNGQQRRSPLVATVRPSSSISARTTSARSRQNNNNNNNNNHTNNASMASSNANNSPESLLLDENGLPRVGHLLAFTPDVVQVFQDAAKAIEESREIKKQTMTQIKDAFNDAKSYSLTVNQSLAQKLADIITLAV